MNGLHALPAGELAAAIREGRTTATAACEHYLARVAALNPAVNAYLTVLPEEALAAAQAADEALARGWPPGPLHGVPIAVKDLVAVRGLPARAGSALRADDPPATEDATALARLRAAGAVLLGTLNMDEFAAGFTTENSHYGPCRNPWDRQRVAGGSSGGSAAAVAAGMAAATLGSDTNGSIRVPAALCGVVGLKPTYGRVSRAGVVPFSWSLDHIGPITRTVADAALLFSILAGPDPRDPSALPDPVADVLATLEAGPGGLRVGVLRRQCVAPCFPEVVAAFDAAVARLSRHLAVEEVEAPDLESARPASAVITWVEGSGYHRRDVQARPERFDPITRNRFRAAALLPAAAYAQAQRVRAVVRQRLGEAFRRVDALLTPTTPFAAPLLVETSEVLELNGVRGPARGLLGFATQPFSFAGLPALSVPIGLAPGGLPVGLQVVGPALGEATVLRLGRCLEMLGIGGALPSPLL